MVKLEDLDLDDDDLEDGNEQDQLEESGEKTWMNPQNETYEKVDPDNDPDDLEDTSSTEEEGEDDLLTSLLKDRGINPHSVKIANADGEVEEKDFNDLTREEQLQILNYNDYDDNYGLDQNESILVNFMRNNHMSVNEYNNYIAQQAIQNYLQNNQQEQSYEIDSIGDDELFVLDLKAKISDLTEEEAVAELEAAKANESLYAKRIQGLREEYKAKEDAINAQEEQEAQQQAAKQAAEFEEVIVNAIKDNDSIDLGDSSITFSEDDMNELASFILDSDAAGVRHIAKALNDPKRLIKMAWYDLHGDEAFSQVSDYYKKKITEAAKYNYLKGYEDARNGRKPNSTKTTTVRRQTQKTNNLQPRVMSINDLD